MKLPKGWKKKRLADLVDPERKITYGIVQPGEFTPDGVPLVRGQDYSFGWVPLEKLFRVSAAINHPYRRSRLIGGDLVMTIVGAGTGNVALVPDYVSGANITQTTARIAVDQSLADTNYVRHQLQSQTGKREVYRYVKGGAQPGLNIGDVEEFLIPLPPLPEQRKIADILTTWDEALTQLDALIETQERRKKALMQQLLTGRRRLKGFDQSNGKTASDRFGTYPADWKRVRLGEVTTEVPTKNAQGTKLPVLSCTKHRGLVLSEEYFGKRVYAEDTSGYRVVQRGEFAYATNHIEEGSIGYQNLCDAGLVSPIYTVFKTTEAVDDSYIFRVLKSTMLIHLYQINTSASVDRRGSLRYDEFSRIHIWLPGKEEQTAIAQVFDTADQQLTLLRTQRSALDQQKRGLMQRLLTGKLRVKP